MSAVELQGVRLRSLALYVVHSERDDHAAYTLVYGGAPMHIVVAQLPEFAGMGNPDENRVRLEPIEDRLCPRMIEASVLMIEIDVGSSFQNQQ
jgi:hypothetical protein